MSPQRGIPLREIDISPVDMQPGELGYTTGRYYIGLPRDTGSVNQSSINDRLRTCALFISKDVRIDRIGVQVAVAQATGSTRLGIYESGDDGFPAKLLLDAGTIDSSTTGFKEITIDQVLRGPRIYWGSYVHNVDSISLRSRGASPSLGFGAGGDVNPDNGVSRTHTFGVLPDPFGAVVFSTQSQNPLYMRVA